ncbi:MAG: hypothetical protein IT371_05755 [Deltaproteobacteria bacterium]|nr:hypothetical protein [Deltaproteobacteria bacterium]
MSSQLVATVFCPTCGVQNLEGVPRCTSCGSALGRDLDLDAATSAQPLRWRWTGIYVGGLALLLAAVTFTPFVKQLFLPLEFPSAETVELMRSAGLRSAVPILLKGGPLTILSLIALFMLAGVALGAVAHRRIYRELAVGGAAVVLFQWVLWIAAARGQVGVLFGSPLSMVSEGAVMHLPAPMFLVTVNILCLLAGVGFARLGVHLAEQLTEEAHCGACDATYRITPKRPLACPGCGVPEQRRSVDWTWAAPAVGGTLVLFFLLVRLGGPPLGFYWRCDFDHPSASCKTGIDTFNRAQWERSDAYFYWHTAPKHPGGAHPGVILHNLKYVGFSAPLFLLAPFLLSWRGRRARARTAVAALLGSWAGATLVAMSLLGFAQFEGIFLVSLRLHLLAAVPWGVAGLFGIWLGRKLSPELLDPGEEP